MPFNEMAMNATSGYTMASTSSATIALVGTVLVLAIIVVFGSWILMKVENFLRAREFVRNFFRYFFYAVKYVFLGAIEIAAIWLLYRALRLLAEQEAVRAFDPVWALAILGALIACFLLGFITERVIRRFKEIRERADQEKPEMAIPTT